MIRLIRAELDRLASRRLPLILLLAALAAVGLFQLAVIESVSPLSPSEVAVARESYQQARQDWQENRAEIEAQCAQQGLPLEQCYPEPTEEDWGLTPTRYDEIASAGVLLSASLAMLVGYLMAASAIGAEYTTGSLSNWLTFVPRRGQVFASKLVAVGLGAAVAGALLAGVMVGASALITRGYDQPLAGFDGVAASAGRGVALAVLAAVLGFCVAMLTRYTVAALGVVIGYLLAVLATNILGFIVPVVSELKRWALETNIQAFLNHGHTYLVFRRQVTAEGVDVVPVERTLSFAAGAGYLAVLAAALVVVTALVFRRRDVV